MASALCVCGGFLIALQVFLSASVTALAFPIQTSSGPSRDVDFAGVSVVRLVVTYTATTPLTPTVLPRPTSTKTANVVPTSTAANAVVVQCTGLGVVVSSWVSQGSLEANSWILTDGNLVDPLQPMCSTAQSTPVKLSKIELYLSSTYHTPSVPAIDILPTNPVFCLSTVCNNENMALISYSGDSAHTLPYDDLATSDMAASANIGLNNPSAPVGMLPTPVNPSSSEGTHFSQPIGLFLTPQRMLLNQTLEPGTPAVNQAGELTGIMLGNKNVVSASTLSLFLNEQPQLKLPQPTHVNPLHDAWKAGIANYYQGNYRAAVPELQIAANANRSFQAPQVFAGLAMDKLNQKSSGGNRPATTPITIGVGGFSVTFPDIQQLIFIALGILLVLLVLIVGLVVRGRWRQKRILKEYAEAERSAEVEAQRIKAQEEMQSPQWSAAPPPSSAVQLPFPASLPVQVSPSPDMRCPNCRNPVLANDNFCAFCRMALSPSASGLHMRVVQPAPPLAQAPMQPPVPLQYSPAPPEPPHVLSEQPTLQIQPPISDEPQTIKMAPSAAGNGRIDTETTLPFGFDMLPSYLKGNRLGFAVGTHSDPGIKRKYKPNEDSLFAARWERTGSAEPVPFGLFVIADGMGGHANGQDASRSAIQTIIDFMLPKLMKNSDAQSNDLEQLLANAVQHANLVVHQHNLEQRADMGTTVTATLVVGTTAYVSNVGDSRTYLYREPDGLKKVTNDHSVVASLVEAGIIKPDDIYTHPKRNQIYRSLGEKSQVEVDSFKVALRPGDKLMLCSDGLWDMVRDPKIEAVVKSPVPDPKMTADALIQAALDGGGEDNVSVIVVSITETAQHTVGHGIQLLAKPDAVQMPQL